MIDEENFISRINEYDFDEGYVVFLVADNMFVDVVGNVVDNVEMMFGAENIETMSYEIRYNSPGWYDYYYILNEDEKTVYRIYAVNYGYKEF